jgi:hypothetical protein
MKDTLLNKIISVAYGDSGFIDRIKIKHLAKKDPQVKMYLEEYSKTAKAAHSLKAEECPVEIVNNVKGKIGIAKGSTKSFFFELYSTLFAHPVISASAVSIVLVVLVTSIIFNRNQYTYNYTQQEIELADKQAKESLFIITKIFNKAQNNLKNEILAGHVAKPISEGLNLVNELFNEGDKNENKN